MLGEQSTQNANQTTAEVDLSHIPSNIIALHMNDAFNGQQIFKLDHTTIVDVETLSREYGRRLNGSEFNRP